MWVYVAIIIGILLCMNHSSRIADEENKCKYEKKCLIAYVVLMVLLSALRYVVYGTDSDGYKYSYEVSENFTFLELIEMYPDNPGYYVLCKLLAMTSLSYHYWFGFVGLVYYGSIALFIHRYSYDKLFSVFMVFTIGIFGFTISGEKQTLAMGFALLSIYFFMDKKYLYAIILILLARSSHTSSLIIIIIFILYYFKNIKTYWIILIIGGVLVITAGNTLVENALHLIDSEHYNGYLNNYSKYAYTELIYYVLIYLAALVFVMPYNNYSSDNAKFFYGSALLCVLAQTFARINADYFRFALYFIPFMVVLVPNACKFDKESSQLIKIGVCCMMIFFMLYTHRNGGYEFMWK